MFIYYRVLLPSHVFNAAVEEDKKENVKVYLQRYPHYLFIRVEGKFAVCERK